MNLPQQVDDPKFGQTAWFTRIGWVCIVAGGLVAALTGPLELRDGSWTAAFLVLVAGVGQSWMGRFQSIIRSEPLPQRIGWIQISSWNAGCAAVIAGTLADLPIVVDVGGFALVVALVMFVHSTRGRSDAVWPRRAYLLLCLVLLISIPIGVTLAHLRAS